MPRARTGRARLRNGKWYAQVTIAKGNRPWFELPTRRTEDEANARAVLLSALAGKLAAASQTDLARSILERAASRDGDALAEVEDVVERLCAGQLVRTSVGADVTISELRKKWTSGELAKTYPDHVKIKRSVRSDVGIFSKWIDPVAGDVPVAQFTIEHAERVMASMPSKLASATRRHVAQALHRLLKLAVFPLRIIKANPLPPGFMPAIGKGRVSEALYPDEDALVMACGGIPYSARLVLGFIAREGTRPGEAANLRWSDLDLRRGVVRLDENKTDDPRSWPMHPGTKAALVAWRELHGEAEGNDHVFVNEAGSPYCRFDDDGNAEMTIRGETYRAWLKLAGVTRAELTIDNDTRRPTRVHDLRGLFVAASLANGKTETWVSERTGHKSSGQINRYRKKARHLAALGCGDLVPLDQALAGKGATTLGKGADGLEASIQVTSVTQSTEESRLARELAAFKSPAFTVSPRGRGDVGAFSAPFQNARAAMIADLSRRVVELVDVGDLEGARIANETITRLIGESNPSGGAVIDLDAERAKREGRDR